MTTKKLDGKTAVITGGATGIGIAAAKRFIEDGAFVFIFGRRQEALDAALAELGPNARAVRGSISDPSDLDRLYAEVKAERGTLDVIFANAGTGGVLPLGEITVEQIDDTFDTNVKGTIFTVQKALPLMGKGGSIILTGSSAGTTGAPAFSVYSASKAAVRNLAKSWAEDLKGTGIRVNVLRSEEHTSELQSLMRISYAVFCLKKKKKNTQSQKINIIHKRITYQIKSHSADHLCMNGLLVLPATKFVYHHS